MASGSNSRENATERDVIITHIFDSPREVVFKAWTNPEYLKRWYAPNGCSIEFRQINISTGGTFHYCIRNPKFHDCWCIGFYHEIIVPEKIVFTIEIADKNGNPVKPANVGMDPEWPQKTIVIVTFSEHHGKTKITLHQAVAERIAKRTGALPSWIEMFERLGKELSVIFKR